MKPCKMKPCKDGKHSWIDVYEDPSRSDMYHDVVRWCEYCGSLVIDVDYDGRTNPGAIAKIRNPEIIKRRGISLF